MDKKHKLMCIPEDYWFPAAFLLVTIAIRKPAVGFKYINFCNPYLNAYSSVTN